MIEIDFDYGLFGKLKAMSGTTWSAYVEHDFVNQLASGALRESCFRRFLTQDYLYLIHCARAYALLAYKGHNLQEVRSAAATLQSVLDEVPVHTAYCQSWGITEEMMADEAEATETMNYTRYILDIGHSGDSLELMAALLPCVAGYGEIGDRLSRDKRTKFEGNPYLAWIRAYEADHYRQSIRTALIDFDEIGKRRGAESRLERLAEIFNTSTRLECAFWQMALNTPDAASQSAAA